MQQKQPFLLYSLLFIFLSAIAIFLSSHHLLFGANFIEDALFPVQGLLTRVVTLPGNLFQNTTAEKLQQENILLKTQLAQEQTLEEDNKALRDQFETTDISTQNLLPMQVIGEPQFFPGVSTTEVIIGDKGSADGVKIGQTVVYKNNVIGNISQVTDHASQVTVVSNKTTSFTAKTSKTGAQGVLTGQGNGVMVLGNVLLSDKLEVGDLVVTSGSQNLSGQGYPPGFVVGKIISVNKNPSSLSQSASVTSLLSFEKLPIIFILQ